MSLSSSRPSSSPWTSLLTHASDDGPALCPTSVVNLFSSLPDPAAALSLSIMDEAQRHPVLPCPGVSLTAETESNLMALARWIYREVDQCTEKTGLDRIMACLFIAAYFGFDTFWACLPRSSNPCFFRRAADIIRKTHIRFQIPDTAPLYEKELCEELKIAMQDRNYTALNSILPSFQRTYYHNGMFLSGVFALAHHNRELFRNLIDSFDGSSLFMLMTILEVLPHELRHRLLSETTNPDVVYLCVLLYQQERGRTPEQQPLLVDMYRKASEIPAIWTALNRCFRYPFYQSADVQEALGVVLAEAPRHVLDVWFDNLSVRPVPLSRNPHEMEKNFSPSFFRSFTCSAGKTEKEDFLTRLYHAYQTFKSSNTSNIALNATNIDYGIYLYYKLYVSDEQKRYILSTIEYRIKDMDNTWFSSDTEWLGTFSCFLSEYQIVYRALHMEEEGYSTCSNTVFVPAFLKGEFHAARFKHALPESHFIRYVAPETS